LFSAILGGILGVAAVLFGARANTPGFCVRDGFWGTHGIGGFLYALGNDTAALSIVAAIWFLYGAMIVGSLGFLAALLLKILNRNNIRNSPPHSNEVSNLEE
jgi:multisubunit Na+/H+ antiporter MnhB subunit